MAQLGGLWQGSAAPRPKNINSGFHRDTFAQGLLKTSFPWVPTKQVEYPHGPSIIPMGSQTLVPTVSLKKKFSQDIHLSSRVPKWSLYITYGVASLCLVPVSSNEALPHAQAGRVPTWSFYNTHGVTDSCTHSLHKNEFSQDTHLPCSIHMAPLQHP